MTTDNAFDNRPDPALSAILRRQLGGDRDNKEFAARVLASLPSSGGLWEVLARWSRPGIAAMVLMAALMGYWLVLRNVDPAAREPTGELAATDRPLDNDALLSVVLGTIR
jgi:hypothetical protein